jgi:chromosome partitioning protein
MQTLTFYCEKGGVSKTTSVLNLAYCLRRRGKRVLIIDCDPQKSLTMQAASVVNGALYDVMVAGAPARDVIVPTSDAWNGVHLLPGDSRSATIEMALASAPGRDVRLQVALQDISSTYDFCLIDSSPTRNAISYNALTASESVIVPLSPGTMDFAGALACLELVEQCRKYSNPALSVRGFLLTRWKKDRLSKDCEKRIRSIYASQVFSSVVPEAVIVGVSNANKLPIMTAAADSPVSLAYVNFCNEVLNHEQKISRSA